MGVSFQIVDPISKITPISDLYGVARTLGGEKKKLLLKNRIPPFTLRVGGGIKKVPSYVATGRIARAGLLLTVYSFCIIASPQERQSAD